MTAQLDLFAASAPVRIHPAEQINIVAQVMRQADEQKDWKQYPRRYRTVLFGSIYDRITEPIQPASHIDDWPPLFYAYCHIRPRTVAATKHGGYQDRKFQ